MNVFSEKVSTRNIPIMNPLQKKRAFYETYFIQINYGRKVGIILKLFRFFRVFLLTTMILLAMGLSVAVAAGNENTSITFTSSFNEDRDLEIGITWKAKVGPVYNGDTEIMLSYSGLPTSWLFPSSCKMHRNSSLESSGTLIIKETTYSR